MKKHRTPEIYRKERKAHNRYHNCLFVQTYEDGECAYRTFWNRAAKELRKIKSWKKILTLIDSNHQEAYYAAKNILSKHESDLLYYQYEIRTAQNFMTEI